MNLPGNTFAWTWTIKQEYLDEYVRIHGEVWPEVLAAHSKAGFRNYSIFQNGNQFFYYFETDDFKKAMAGVAADDACNRWNKITGPMIDGGLDFASDDPVPLMKQVFYLK